MLNSLNDSSVNISWTSPSSPNGILTGYNILIRRHPETTSIFNQNITSGAELSLIATNLG